MEFLLSIATRPVCVFSPPPLAPASSALVLSGLLVALVPHLFVSVPLLGADVQSVLVQSFVAPDVPVLRGLSLIGGADDVHARGARIEERFVQEHLDDGFAGITERGGKGG